MILPFRREDLWLSKHNIGQNIIWPGAAVGILLNWWNAEDGRNGAGRLNCITIAGG